MNKPNVIKADICFRYRENENDDVVYSCLVFPDLLYDDLNFIFDNEPTVFLDMNKDTIDKVIQMLNDLKNYNTRGEQNK